MIHLCNTTMSLKKKKIVVKQIKVQALLSSTKPFYLRITYAHIKYITIFLMYYIYYMLNVFGKADVISAIPS